jgi:hypothetical protein
VNPLPRWFRVFIIPELYRFNGMEGLEQGGQKCFVGTTQKILCKIGF